MYRQTRIRSLNGCVKLRSGKPWTSSLQRARSSCCKAIAALARSICGFQLALVAGLFSSTSIQVSALLVSIVNKQPQAP
ncbi:hypothetical protein D3C80_2038020 [compost metagenome]